MIPRCWYCPDEPPLALMVRAREIAYADEDDRVGHEVIVLMWSCPVCENGRIAREQPEVQPTLPLECQQKP